MLSYSPVQPVPYVTYEEYSRLTGLPMGTIKDYVSKGKILIKKKERTKEKPLVNMVAMNEMATREALEMLG
ncbi:hypothetical protein [Vibrio scophthalmi]|uniref:DNA-binding protein n=1 Tax=Vibrio scophthalmi TaxID=45658 RepID=A0A1C7FB76_9VIBR|nr:hypothetical protein [Vibrio scophthalmi]ANU36259.1 hypothetical protein VSVS05_01132 [Vibrio scophthalmi]